METKGRCRSIFASVHTGYLLILSFLSTQSLAESIELADRLLRIQPFKALPKGLILSPQTVQFFPNGTLVLNAKVSGVQDSLVMEGATIPCSRECSFSLALKKRSEVYRLRANGQDIDILIHWLNLPTALNRSRGQIQTSAGVRVTEDLSGFDPAAYSLIVTSDNRRAEQVSAQELPTLSVRPFTYAAADVSEWRLVILQDNKSVAHRDAKGALPQVIPLDGVPGISDLVPGKYQLRLDIVYAGKFVSGQQIALEVLSSQHKSWRLASAELAGQVFVSGGSSYFAPEIRWVPGYFFSPHWGIRAVLSFSMLKVYLSQTQLLFTELGLRAERHYKPFGFSLGAGLTKWHGTTFSAQPYFEAGIAYDLDFLGLEKPFPRLVSSYTGFSLLDWVHVARLGLQFEF